MTRAADLESCHLPRPLGFSGVWPLPGTSPQWRRAREPDGLFFRVVRIFRDGGATNGRYGEVVSAPYYFEADETPCCEELDLARASEVRACLSALDALGLSEASLRSSWAGRASALEAGAAARRQAAALALARADELGDRLGDLKLVFEFVRATKEP